MSLRRSFRMSILNDVARMAQPSCASRRPKWTSNATPSSPIPASVTTRARKGTPTLTGRTHTAPVSTANPEQSKVSLPLVVPRLSTGRRAVFSRARSPIDGSAGETTLSVVELRVSVHDRMLSRSLEPNSMLLSTNTAWPLERGGDRCRWTVDPGLTWMSSVSGRLHAAIPKASRRTEPIKATMVTASLVRCTRREFVNRHLPRRWAVVLDRSIGDPVPQGGVDTTIPDVWACTASVGGFCCCAPFASGAPTSYKILVGFGEEGLEPVLRCFAGAMCGCVPRITSARSIQYGKEPCRS